MEDESECHENKKSYCVVTEVKYVLKNNGGHKPYGFGSRSIVVVRQ